MVTKPWYLSKGMWAGIVGLAIVVWNAIPQFIGVTLPPIPEYVLGILTALGLYARASTTTAIR